MILSVKGINTARSKMLRRARNIRNTRGVNGRIITDWFKAVQVNFQTSGGGHKPPKRWKPLKPATLAQKKKQGYSSKPLIRTGTLRQQWLTQADSRGGKLTSTARAKGGTNYGMVHEKGSKKRNIPKRKILPTLKHASVIATKHMGKHVKFAIKVT